MKQRHDFRNSSKPHIFDSDIYIVRNNILLPWVLTITNLHGKYRLIQLCVGLDHSQ